jgi:hypothetical protein
MKLTNGIYSPPEWHFEKRYYTCSQNGNGHWWCTMYTTHDPSKPKEHWYPIYIRDSNPFKRLNSAIKYVEKFIEQDKKKGE